MEPNQRPWFAPDAQGFLATAIIVMCFTALLVRMFHPVATEDKMLDTMITILFSTCLVTVYQFTFGSSRGSQVKDETQSKMLEKSVPAAPIPPNGPPIPPAAIAAAAEAAAPAAAAIAAPPAAAVAAPPAAEVAVEAALNERGIGEKPKDI